MPYKIFGCKVNKFYINQRLEYYQQQNSSLKDTLLIATCVVTDRAKNKRLKEVKLALKEGMNVNITGCWTLEKGTLISNEKFFTIYPELLPYQDKLQLLWEAPKTDSSYESMQKNKTTNIYTKNFVVIQNGCDNYCSFCLTVLKRGQHRNRDLQDIISEIKNIEQQGGKEIVITWINLAARGSSNTRVPEESKFSELLEEIIKQTTIPRIRISSIGPEYANDHFFEVVKNERILPHFHYSIQSFSNNVLKNMKRNYSADQLKQVLKKTRQLQRNQAELISIGADIITGFPGESESDFLDTVIGVKEFWITKLHAFPFSNHQKWETIPASLYPNQIAEETKKQRNRTLIEVGDQVRAEFLERNKWTSHKILIEEHKQGKRRGRTENYIQVELEGKYKKGEIISYTL